MSLPPAAPVEDRSKAACDYIKSAVAELGKLDKAVCTGAGGPPPPPPVKSLTKTDIEAWLTGKASANTFLTGYVVTETTPGTEYDIAVGDKTYKMLSSAGTIDEQANAIAAALSGTSGQKMAGGRRGKRSARRNRRSFKGGRGNRSRRSKGSKGRKCRGRTNKRRNGGAKIGPELKAWMERQKAATGKDPISKKTIAKTKTKSQATGSDQRLESGKHVVAQKRGY
jgi:hypothetical protein